MKKWLTSTSPLHMLRHALKLGDLRKVRLALCGYLRHPAIWPLLQSKRSRRAVEVAEQYADGEVDRQALQHAQKAASDMASSHYYYAYDHAHPGPLNNMACALNLARVVAYTDSYLGQGWYFGHFPSLDAQRTGHRLACETVRDVFGNPFRPTRVESAWLSYSDNLVGGLARAIYEGRKFEDLPILADALEDAGCTDQRVLDHCRRDEYHVRGCWVIDLLLGKGA